MNRIASLLLAAAATFIVHTASAFPFTHISGLFGDILVEESVAEKNDTVPGSLDAHIQGIDRAAQKLSQQLMEKDWTKLDIAIQSAVARLNTVEFEVQIKKARQQLEESRDQLNSKLQTVLNSEALAEQMKSLEKAMEKLESEQERIRTEIQKQKEVIKNELNRSRPKIEEELKKAKIQLDKARTDLINFKKMISEMVRERLIKDPANYRIAFHEGELLIDGTKQPDAVYNKFKSYFSEPGTVLENKNDRFEIHKEKEQ